MYPKKVSLFFRKKLPSSQSIEMLFDNISLFLKQNQDEFIIIKNELPNQSSSINDFIKNIWYSFKKQTSINHITGDIYYIALALNPLKTIITIHDCVLLKHKANSPLFWLYRLIWFKIPVRLCKIVTTISEKSKQELIYYTGVNAEKVKVISNFYDPIFKYIPHKFNKNETTILQIGTTPNKNVERLIIALKQANISCKLIIVGQMMDVHLKVLKETDLAYENYVNISKERLFELYKQCDIVSFISTYEGFGLPLIEANAVGRVVLTSNISPMLEVAKESAHFVNPNDAEDIVMGIKKIISHDEYRDSLIENGRKNILNYSLEEIAFKYYSLYESL